MTPELPKLLDPLRDAVRLKHHSRRTEDTYAAWVARYTLRVFQNLRHPKDPRSDKTHRHHIDESGLQKAVRSPLD